MAKGESGALRSPPGVGAALNGKLFRNRCKAFLFSVMPSAVLAPAHNSRDDRIHIPLGGMLFTGDGS
jgi:hypothetical protein